MFLLAAYIFFGRFITWPLVSLTRIACGRKGSLKAYDYYDHKPRESFPPSALEISSRGYIPPPPSPPPLPPRTTLQPPAPPRKSIKRGKLVKQESIVPIITDSSGAMKMTFWM